MAKLEYPPTNDLLFKILLQDNPNVLRSLIAAVLNTSPDEIKDLEIIDKELLPHHEGKKYIRLDVRVHLKGKQLDLEMQTSGSREEFKERALYYWASMYANSIDTAHDYLSAPKTIVASFLDFDIFDDSDYYSEFCVLETRRFELLCDKLSLRFYELKRLPHGIEDTSDMLLMWLKFFSAKTEEDLGQLQKLGIDVIDEAVSAMTKITQQELFQVQEQRRRLALADYTTGMNRARAEGVERGIERGVERGRAEGKAEGLEQGVASIAQRMASSGFTTEQILVATGLDEQRLRKLLDN
jgi:predicted transposase/invertase (TIGR01784 family)